MKRREAAIQPSTFNSVDLEVFKWFLIFFACVAMMFGAYISDGPLPTLYDAAPEAPLFHAFADPELKSAVQSLLEGGLTPLIHNPVKWKKLEVASRMEVKALF